MVHTNPLGNSPSDNPRPKLPNDLAALVVATIPNRNIYTPTYLEVNGVTPEVLALIKAKVPEYPWSDVDQALLRCVHQPESLNLRNIGELRGPKGLPEVTQFQKFLLQPGGEAVEFQHHVVATERSVHPIASTLSFVRTGPHSAPPRMRVELLGGSRDERWSFIDTLAEVLSGRRPSIERSTTELANLARLPLTDVVAVGLMIELREKESASQEEPVATPTRHLWVPTSLEVPDPSYDVHQVMTSHVFPGRYEEILRSGVLVHLEAYANDTKPVSVNRLSRISRSLERPLIASFRRTYEPSLSWFRTSTGETESGALSTEAAPDPRGVFSEALLSDPSQRQQGRCLTFFAPHWNTTTDDGALEQLGSITMAFYDMADATGTPATLSIAARWRQLLRLLRDLNIEVTVAELSRTLRETHRNGELEGRHVSAVAVKLGDDEQNPSRLLSAHFAVHNG